LRGCGLLNVKGVCPDHFFLQSAFSAFSLALQSILPPPWLPAKEGADTISRADTNADITSFMIDLLKTRLGRYPQNAPIRMFATTEYAKP
jgi:hypothetical protein